MLAEHSDLGDGDLFWFIHSALSGKSLADAEAGAKRDFLSAVELVRGIVEHARHSEETNIKHVLSSDDALERRFNALFDVPRPVGQVLVSGVGGSRASEHAEAPDAKRKRFGDVAGGKPAASKGSNKGSRIGPASAGPVQPPSFLQGAGQNASPSSTDSVTAQLTTDLLKR